MTSPLLTAIGPEGPKVLDKLSKKFNNRCGDHKMSDLLYEEKIHCNNAQQEKWPVGETWGGQQGRLGVANWGDWRLALS